jgi:hypothetical protein
LSCLALAALGYVAAQDIDLNTIIAIGKEVWNVVENYQPTSDVSTASASAVPAGVTDWTQISGWQETSSDTYEWNLKDLVHITLVDYKYRVLFDYGGQLTQNGVTGLYVANVRVQPDEVYVNWANSFNSTVTISQQILNIGSTDAPIAAMQIVHRMHFHNLLQDEVQEDTFVVDAEGGVKLV